MGRTREAETSLFTWLSRCVVRAAWENHGLTSRLFFGFFVSMHLSHGACQPGRPRRRPCLTFLSPETSGGPATLDVGLINASGTQSKAV